MGSNKPVRKAPELTNEVWSEVLSHLEYYDLLRCKRVSKQLKAVTQLDRFDAVLWRSKPVFPNLEEGEDSSFDDESGTEGSIKEGTYLDPTNIRLHPAFDLVASMTLKDGVEDMFNIWILTKPDGGGRRDVDPLILTSACEARATEPAVTVVCVDLRQVQKEGGYITVRNDKGVTVMDIMAKICVFSAKHDHSIQRKKLSFVGLSPYDELADGVVVLESFWTRLY